MRTLGISLLGDFRLSYGDEIVTSVNAARLQSLLAYLLLHRQAPQARQHVAFQFWPDSSEKQAHTNLRKLLFQLRNALPDPDHFLTQDHLTVQWRTDAPYTLDIAELEQVLARCSTANGKRAASARQADLTLVANLYAGELLPGCLDEWILPVRQQLHREAMQALEQLISLSEHQREYRAGIRYAQRLLGLDPLDEATYRRLMQLHALNSDRAAALHSYHTCATLLQRELGVEPDEETRSLYERILHMEGQAPQPPAPIAEAPLVGRVEEWRMLLATWRKAQRGQAHFVSLAGEAGMGKTRLAEALITWARAQGGRAAYTRSYEAEGGLAYAPVTEWLRASVLKPALRKLDKVWLTELARLLPELLTEYRDLAAPAPLSEAWQRQRFFESLARAVLIDPGPLLLVIDDLQWCDGETMSWLHYLLRYAAQTRLLVIGAWRNEAVDDRHPLHILLRDLENANQLTAIELASFTAAETAELAQHMAEHPLDAQATQRLYQMTEGHPLFVVEMVRAGDWRVEIGDQLAAPNLQSPISTLQSVPPKVQAVIQSRLAQLSGQARELAGLAATIGRRFTFPMLLRAGQVDEDTLVHALDELWQRRIVREQGADAYDFAHDKIREVAYQALSHVRRRLLHRRVAEALETVYRSILDEISGQLATHYEQGGVLDKASAYFQRAGEHAARQFVGQEALRYFQHALTLTPEANGEERYQLLLLCEKVYEIQGQSDARYQNLLALQQLVTTDLEVSLQTQAREAEVAAALAQYYRQTGNYEVAIRMAQAAIAKAQASKTQAIAAKGYYVLGFTYWGQGKMALARAPLEQSAQSAHALGLDAMEARALEQLAATEMFSGGDAATIQDYLDRCMAIYQRHGDLYGQASICNKLVFLPFAQGDSNHAEAIHAFERGLGLSRQIGARGLEAHLTSNFGYLQVFAGNYAQAATWQATSLQLARDMKDRMREATTLTYMGERAFQQGNLAEAEIQHNACLALAESIGSEQWRSKALHGLSCLCCVRGEYEQAATFSQAALGSAQTVGDSRLLGNALVGLGHALSGLGQLAKATSIYQEAYVIRHRLKQYNRSVEALGGLAHIALQQAALSQAQPCVEQILAHLATSKLEATDEALHVYMTCYQVLVAVKDTRAADLLRCADEQLQARAATLETDNERQLFWAALIHAEVLVATQKGR